jgi:transcriptional regulator
VTLVYKTWTTGEKARVMQMRSLGMSTKEISTVLGRSEASVASALRYVSPPPRPRIEKPKPTIVTPSDKLRDATLRALLRWANDNGTTIDDAARVLLSGVAA